MLCGIRFESLRTVALFPGCVGGEKAAWYPLFAHARAFVFICKWSVKLICIRPIHFRIVEKATSEKALSVHVRCLETCHAVRKLCPEFPFDCLDLAYTETASKPSPLATDTADMRSNLHRRERQSSHNPTSLKRAAEYLGQPCERQI